MLSKRYKYILRFVFIFFCLVFICIGSAYFEARNIKLKEVTFSSKDLPDAFIGKKVIFLSDIHVNQYFTAKDIAKLVERVNERNPDLVLLGGDNTRKNATYSEPFFKEIGKLKTKYGVYSVLGNHDHWEGAAFIQEGLQNSGVNICDNQSFWVKEGSDSIKIGGVGDFWEDSQLLGNTTDDVKSDDFCILLSHNPDYIENIDSDCVDLMLSGHTHAGQITFFGLWAPIMPSSMHPEYMQTGQKYRYGWKEKGGVKLYVSSGVGMGAFPFRFFAKPEIVEITLAK